MKKRSGSLNRRSFLTAAVATSVAAPALARVLASDVMPDKPALKVGLVGCGGRGRGATRDILEGAPNIQITALADVFQDRVDQAAQGLQELGQGVPGDRRFVGFDAYLKLLETDIDVVLLAEPPHFRPSHFAAAVEAGKHVFMEKPVAVDAPGIRSVLETGKKAEQKGLCVVAGTQRRHQTEYLEAYQRIADGAIGEIVAGRCYWLGNQLWYRERQPDWNVMEWMIRDWVNWCWLSGDHIVEQHVHNIDVVLWFSGKVAVQAVGTGHRARRVTGDQFDFFSVDFELEDGKHFLSMCRQINGCHNDISEFVVGTRGTSDCRSQILDLDGNVVWRYEGPRSSPYVQEQADLVRAIRTGNLVNETRNVSEATLTAIMARESAYTGRLVTREEILNSDVRLGPQEYAWGDVPIGAVPRPGAEAGPPRPV